MAYSSNFNLDSDRYGSRSGSVHRASSRPLSDGHPADESRSQRFARESAPRTTNRITVSGKDPSSAHRTPARTSQSNRSQQQTRTSGRSSGSVSRSTSRSVDVPRSQRSHDRASRPERHLSEATRGSRADRGQKGSQRQPSAKRQPQAQPVSYAASPSDSILGKIFDILKLIVVSIVKLIAFIIRSIGRGFTFLWDKSKVIGCAVILIVVLVCGLFLDSALNADKIYKGVSIGDVDVAGMTQEEAANALSSRYGDKLANTSVYIFTSEDAAKNTNVDEVRAQEEILAEQISAEEALENKVLWVESSDTLGARLPVQELAAEAYEFGRSSGFFDRFSTLMHPHEIAVELDYNQTMLSKLLSDINTAIGDPAQEYGLSVQDGQASVVEGHDGYEIDKDTFQATLTDKLLNSEVDDPRYIPVAEYVTLKVDAESAQRTADAVNEALTEGASFKYGDATADISKETLGSWVSAAPAQRGEEWYLKPELSEQKALETLTENLNLDESGGKYAVSFEVSEEGVSVKPNEEVTIPNVGTALTGLDQALFGSYCDTGNQKIAGERFGIAIQTEQSAGPLTLDESLAYGIVTKFSTYTTEFNSSTSTMNRMYNIQKAADLIDDSVIKADGGTWSFNETAGDCNAEAGFKEAGVISGDEMTQEAGGGVCQVATTVFNSVYEAGLPVKERHNHTLSSSSYPAGRDAAIAYPTLDLVWENDTDSDILLTTSYDSHSITVDLIGEDPELEVITDTGDWGKGDPYKVKVEVDETYADTAVVKMTNGSDGLTINVTRTVKDKDGNVVDQKTFSSVYSPVNELYKVGPKVVTAKIQRKYAREDTSSTSSDASASSSSSSSSSSSGSSGSSTATTT